MRSHEIATGVYPEKFTPPHLVSLKLVPVIFFRLYLGFPRIIFPSDIPSKNFFNDPCSKSTITILSHITLCHQFNNKYINLSIQIYYEPRDSTGYSVFLVHNREFLRKPTNRFLPNTSQFIMYNNHSPIWCYNAIQLKRDPVFENKDTIL